MPGSPTTPGWPSARVGALGHVAFHYTDSVGTRNQFSIAAQWLACTSPCRRFADILADAGARLGADVGHYSFIAVDLHHLLLAGLPAHLCENAQEPIRRRIVFSIVLFAVAATALFVFRLTKSRRTFYAQIECLCFHICGRLRERKKNPRDSIARSQVPTSVLPVLRPLSCRGPVWEFADRVQITATRSRRRVKNWLPDPVSH